ncbi:MAG: helix-turn-helix transcriptional regulator [Oscillospiraceae bacterium]|nr:helix-turn-helix transcriptional regulator [Oscillospiraceae bacterium]
MRNNCAGKPIPDKDVRSKNDPLTNLYNIFLKQELADINPVSVGEIRDTPDAYRGIHTADCTNFYRILDGSGTLFLNDQVIPVKKDDLFIVPLGAKAGMRPAPGKTIPHRWVGFTGTLTHEFERFPVPFTLPPEVMAQLYTPNPSARNLGSRLAADLFLIHSIMQEPEENEPDYIQKIVNRINTSYMEKLSVTQMAADLGLDRCHLSRVFKSKMNMSIQDYILQFRLSKAKRYLKHGYSTSDTAALCGFTDRVNFSKVFTREIGCSPTEWKKILDWETWNRPR